MNPDDGHGTPDVTGSAGRVGPEDGSSPADAPAGERLDFFAELKRRKVYRVGAAYLAAAYALVEGASLVFPTFGLGPAVFNGLVLASVLGFPLAVVLAWVFEVSEGGIRRTASSGSATVVPTADRWVRLKAAGVGAGFVAIVWMAVGLWQPMGSESGSHVPTAEPVLAVLPFEDFSPGADQAYLADGLHEELLHRLATLDGIRLISRTSVSHFRDSPATVSTIADSLGARYVLEGSVRRAGDSVRVTVQLIDASSDAHLWSESYAAALALDELFELQRDLASRVARSTGGTLSAGTGGDAGDVPTTSLEAYHAYLRSLHHWSGFDTQELEAAAEDLERAIALDPRFGRAHGKLALVYGVLNNFGNRTQGELFPVIRMHAEQAMRYAPNDPVSHMAMMAVYWAIERDWEGAKTELETALDLDPDYADARWALAEWYGVIAGNTDRGLEVIRDAIRLDPLSVHPRTVRGWILFVGQRYGEAAEEFQRLVQDDPGNRQHVLDRASALALAGRREEALQLVQGVLPSIPSPRPVTLAVHLARAGDTVTARQVLDAAVALKRSGGSVPASGVAAALSSLGQVDEAMAWLERSFDEEGGVYTLRSPDWLQLHGHPRFDALWERVGLPGDPPAGPSPT